MERLVTSTTPLVIRRAEQPERAGERATALSRGGGRVAHGAPEESPCPGRGTGV